MRFQGVFQAGQISFRRHGPWSDCQMSGCQMHIQHTMIGSENRRLHYNALQHIAHLIVKRILIQSLLYCTALH